MNKSERLAAFVETLPADPALGFDPCYQGYFRLFNEARYYEAHDVLEHLWLAAPREDANYNFFKGLIQIAGAFVHLQKQYRFPDHPKHGRRLRPAARLFELGRANLSPYGSRYMGLDLDGLLRLCAERVEVLSVSDFTRNPWDPDHPPQVLLGHAD